MKRLFISFCILFLIDLCAIANATIDTTAIYKNAKSVSKSSDLIKLSNSLTKPYSDDASKILSITYWIHQNIKPNKKPEIANIADTNTIYNAIKKGKADSFEYSQVFVSLCKLANIQAIFVPGYIRDFDFIDNDTIYRTNYHWALVKENSTWKIVDVANIAKNQFNGNEIYSPTKIFVVKHLACAPMFQLLNKAVTMQTFQKGERFVKTHLTTYPQTKNQNPLLDEYAKLSEIDTYIKLADEIFDYNPYNYIDKGLYYAKAVNIFKEKTYLNNVERIHAPVWDLRKMQYAGFLSDSLIKMGISQINYEYNTVKKRSGLWKQKLSNNNKGIIANTKKSLLHYKNQEKKLYKSQKLYTYTQTYINKFDIKYSETDIEQIFRPISHVNEQMYESIYLRIDLDSMKLAADSILNRLDSLTNVSTENDFVLSVKKENESLEIFKKNNQDISEYVQKRNQDKFLVYKTNINLYKQKYSTSHSDAQSISSEYTDTITSTFVVNQNIMIDILKTYTENYNKQIQTIKAIKKASFKEENEDEVFAKTVQEYKQNLKRFADYSNIIKTYTDSLNSIISKEILTLQESITHLQKDIEFEAARHLTYTNFRKTTKEAAVLHYKALHLKTKTEKKLIDGALK